jgi:DNA-binding MarR family transcriptional regulator
MVDAARRQLASRMVVVLPRYGLWANGFREVTTPHGRVGYRQFTVLWMLRHNVFAPEEVTATRLAEFFDVQPSVMTRALAKLELAGFISRKVDQTDRRRSHIEITDTGREVSEYVQEVITQDLLHSMSLLQDDQIDELGRNVELLDQIADDLERQQDRPSLSLELRAAG